MHRLLSVWRTLLGSLWFLPSVLVALGVAAAVLLVELHAHMDHDLAAAWPRLFGAGAEGARGMLSAIATSMVTVAGVVFSVTIVALSLTASQYSPRVLRNFMSDRPTQVVLGAFVAVFAYCLIVLRTIRGGDEGAFVPSLAVLGGVLMAFVGIGLLIYFVHHVATAIQVDHILQRIAHDTRLAIDRLCAADADLAPASDAASAAHQDAGAPWTSIAADSTGYLLSLDTAALLALATGQHTVLRVLPQVGDFLVAGMPAVQVAPGAAVPQGGWQAALAGCLHVQCERNVHQDPGYGLQQLVDVGLRALSPGVHDPTTAVGCVDHLGALLHHLSGRRLPGGRHAPDGRLRLLLAMPDYAQLVGVALAGLTHHAGSHAQVHARLIAAVASAAAATDDPGRLAVLAQQLDAHLARLPHADLSPASAAALQRQAAAVRAGLRARPPRQQGLAPPAD